MKNWETEKEITEIIKSTLEGYQENYIPGAWENFVNIRKRKRRVLYMRLAAAMAACLLFGWIGISQLMPHAAEDSATVQNTSEILKDLPMQPFPVEKIMRGQEPSKDQSQPRKPEIYVHQKVVSDSTLNNSTTVAIAKNDGNVPSLDSVQSAASVKSPGTDAGSIQKKQKSSVNRTIPDPGFSGKLAVNQPSEKRKIRFGINFSPGVNSTASGTSFNYSGGVSTDIQLFADVFITTGLQLEHQNVINDIVPSVSAVDNSFATPASRMKADLLNLDLPVNLTWKFFSGKDKSFYISGGISSLAYLSEKYDKTTTFQHISEIKTMADGVSKTAYRIENLETTEEKTAPSFNAIDLAGRVNLLFGMEQRLTSKLSLHIEPYVKIPVSGLATEKLRFSTGGVSCKVSF